MTKATYYIEGSKVGSLEQFYEEISESLIPNVAWGRNLDAFNDILGGGFGLPEEGFTLVWQNAALSKKHLGHGETVRQLQKRLEHCHPSAIPDIERMLEAAQRGEGPTVYDWLIEIIREHPEIDLILKSGT